MTPARRPTRISLRVGGRLLHAADGSTMESFEQFVAVAMEAEGFVVSKAVKFPVQRKTRKASHPEVQTHGYEVDLIGARSNRLVLATVKSFFG